MFIPVPGSVETADILFFFAAAVLQPADNSLPAIAHVLNQIGDVMKGGIKPGKSIVKGSVRFAAALIFHTQESVGFHSVLLPTAPQAVRSVYGGQHRVDIKPKFAYCPHDECG